MSSKRSNSNVYRIKQTRDEIVDDILDIIDGPRPMKDFRPSKTKPNGADRFWRDHQGEYEARGRGSTDRVDRVRRHNTAYPQLWDELDKRRSVAKTKPNGADRFWRDQQGEYEARGRGSTDRVDRVRRHNTAYPQLWDELDKRRSVAKVTALKRNLYLPDEQFPSACDICLDQMRRDLMSMKPKTKRIGNRKLQKKSRMNGYSRNGRRTRYYVKRRRFRSKTPVESPIDSEASQEIGKSSEISVKSLKIQPSETASTKEAAKKNSKSDVGSYDCPSTTKPSAPSNGSSLGLGNEPMDS